MIRSIKLWYNIIEVLLWSVSRTLSNGCYCVGLMCWAFNYYVISGDIGRLRWNILFHVTESTDYFIFVSMQLSHWSKEEDPKADISYQKGPKIIIGRQHCKRVMYPLLLKSPQARLNAKKKHVLNFRSRVNHVNCDTERNNSHMQYLSIESHSKFSGYPWIQFYYQSLIYTL